MKTKYNSKNLRTIFLLTLLLFSSTGLMAQYSYNSGNCLVFDGATSGVTFTDNDMGLDTLTNFSVTTWIKWSSKNSASQSANIVALDRNASNGDEGQFWLEHNKSNSRFIFSLQTVNGRVSATGTTNPQAGTWYHVAGVYDGSFMYLYVNGMLEAKVPQTGKFQPYQSDYKLNFGQWAFPGNGFRRFNGMIDEVSIWKTALSKDQVRAYMCQKLGGKENGLIGYWRMNESSGNMIHDMTAFQRHGTTQNTVISVSGAPIGDQSKFFPSATFASLKNPVYQDSVTVSNFSAIPQGVVMYRVDTLPNVLTPPPSFTALHASYYYGVFIVGSPSITYEMKWYHNGHPEISGGANLLVAAREKNDTQVWTDIMAINDGNGVLSKAGQRGRNEYVLGENNPLPVELLSFNANCQDNGSVLISWTTATEISNDYFTIQRSTDGKQWANIGTVTGAGNSNQVLNYEFTDNEPLQELSYYRLMQTDYNGAFEVFDMAAVQCTMFEKAPVISPVPASDFVTIDFEMQQVITDPVKVNIYTSGGQLVYTRDFYGSNGNNYQIDVTGLNNGIYFMHVIIADKYLFTKKFIVEKNS